MAGTSRFVRKEDDAKVADLAATEEGCQQLAPFAAEIADALNRPEARTRVDALAALTALLRAGLLPQAAELIPDAEDALFDENSSPLRAQAFRFYIAFAATGQDAAAQVWPTIDEILQVCHGNAEYNEMLILTCEYAAGAPADVKEALAASVKFDAENAKGTLKMRCENILAACNA